MKINGLKKFFFSADNLNLTRFKTGVYRFGNKTITIIYLCTRRICYTVNIYKCIFYIGLLTGKINTIGMDVLYDRSLFIIHYDLDHLLFNV